MGVNGYVQEMTEKQLERVLTVAVILLFVLHLIVVPFGNIYLKGWTLDLERRPNVLWVLVIAAVSIGLAILFSLMGKNVHAALQRATTDVRSSLRPAVWSCLALTAFLSFEVLFVLATLSRTIYTATRLPLFIGLVIAPVAVGITTTLFTRRLKDKKLKQAWLQLLGGS